MNKIQGKTLQVNEINHENLSILKVRGHFKSLDELISEMLKVFMKEKKKNGN